MTPSARKECRALAYFFDTVGFKCEPVSPLTPDILRINIFLRSLFCLSIKFSRRIKCSKKKSPGFPGLVLLLNRKLFSASSASLLICSWIIAQCFNPSKSLNPPNSLFLCLAFRIAWLFIERSVSNFP